MYQYIFQIFFFLINPQYFYNIEQKNQLKIEFNEAFQKKDFKKSIQVFEKISRLTNIIDPELSIDVAHAYFENNDTLNARIQYQNAQHSPDLYKSSQALNQLGLLKLLQKDSSSAIEYFKQSLLINPELAAARYNYELIYKLYKPKNQNLIAENEQLKKQQVIASNEKEDEFDEYKSDKISKEKALQLLEDLKISETTVNTNKKNSKTKIEKDW